MLKTNSSKNRVNQDLCEYGGNTLENMMNVVNLTKRVAALEKSIQNLTSLIENKNEEKSVKLFENSKVENFLVELPLTQNLSNCQFEVTEKDPPKSSAKMSDLQDLERHLKVQNDSVFSSINLNHLYLHQQICNIQKQMGKVEGQIADTFFACEQNDEKIDETILSMDEFNSKIFCLKSDVKGLLGDSREIKKKIIEINEKYETMNNVKANKSDVDEQLKLNMKIIFGELEKMVKVKDHDETIDAFRMRMAINEENFKKFRNDMKKSMICLFATLDEKLHKNELKEFKSLVAKLFDDFVNDLQNLFFNISQNAVAMGASKHLQTNLKCIACNSKVSMTTEFPELQKASTSFRNKFCRAKIPKKSLKSGVYCAKNFFKVKNFPPRHQSLQFPPSTQQCFLISADNTIVRADPLKFLLNTK